MNKKLKIVDRFSVCLLAVSLLCGGVFAGARVAKETLQVDYNDLKIVVDGQQIELKDPNGKTVEPFACEGTTYVPFRAVASAFGYDVDYDGKTKTIYLSKPGEMPDGETNWMKKLPPYQTGLAETYDDSDRSKSFSVAGEKHTAGVVLNSRWQNGAGNVGGYAIWNTNTRYKSVTFTIGSLDGNSGNQTLKVDLDGSYLTEYELQWDAPPQTITVPLDYCASLKLYLNGTDSHRAYGIYDISFAE